MRKLTTKIQKFNIDKDKRVIVIGDIHAHTSYLKNLLIKTNFSNKDELFLIGDYIERGTNNLECLRYVMELSKKPNIHTILGNNDAFIFTAINEPTKYDANMLFNYIQNRLKWFDACTITDMCKEIGIALEKESDVVPVLTKLKENFSEEQDFIFSLPTIIDTQNFTFVHGGLTDAKLENCESQNPFNLMKNDEFLTKSIFFNKFVVVGHWPTILYKQIQDCSPIFDFEKKILSIDGGCGVKTCGQLNALIIENNQSENFSFVSYDELEKFIADKNQEESPQNINILWGKNEIKVLENNGDLSYIYHVQSERTAYIPSDLIFKEGKIYKSDDFSDYKLSVKKGDELAFIDYKKGFGKLVKKDSTIGWYNP
ncbi:MAG: metallophosphoesterase [Clostridia bacterium]